MNRRQAWVLLILLLLPRPAPASRPGDGLQTVVIPTIPVTSTPADDVPADGADLTAETAIRLALEHNPDIVSAATELQIADAALKVAEETWFPTASLTLGGSNSATGGVGGQGFGGTQASESGLISIGQTVSDFGKTRAAVASAEANLAGARATLLQRQEDVALIVRQQYFLAIADSDLVTIDEDSVADQTKHLAQAQALYKKGTKARLDVAQAETSLATARLALVQAQSNRNRDFVNLNVAMGLPRIATYKLTASIELPPPGDGDALCAQAYRMRPDLLILDTQVEAAESNLSLAHMGFNPVVSANAGVQQFTAQGQTGSYGYSYGLSLQMPLLDAGAQRAGIESALASLNGLKATRISLRNSIFQSVQNDLGALREAVASVDVAKAGQASAAESFHLASGRYRAGLGSSLDVLDAELAYSQARSALVTAQTQAFTAQAQLEHDVGSLEFLPSMQTGPRS